MQRKLFPPLLAVWLLAVCLAQGAAADFVELEHALAEPGAGLAQALAGDAVVVAVRNGGEQVGPWNIAQAVGLEIAAALGRHHVDTIRAAADTRFQKLETVDRPFAAVHLKGLNGTERQALVGIEWLASKKPSVKIAAFRMGTRKTAWTKIVALPAAAVSLDQNIPPANLAVVEFSRKSLGTAVGDGDCTRLAEEALKAAGLGKRGVYRWGRELGPQEPWLPGDLLQMERVNITLPGASRVFVHHTAVIEEVQDDAVVALHQNAFPAGKIVQRERWPLAGINGNIAAYRPWDWPKDNPMPPACPVRATPALDAQAKRGKPAAEVNLLELVNPRLDHVQGIWFFEKSGPLRSPCEFEARLQVALEPPPAYSLDMTIERLQGSQCFGLGVVVGGRQTMLEIDGDNLTVSGIHNLDGKPAKDNESRKEGTFLPLGKRAHLVCGVRPDEIALDIDARPVIHWRGDTRRLSVSPDWPVPHGNWLFLGAFNSEFEISSFKLEAAK